MSLLEIRKFPEPVLKKKCKNVAELTPKVEKLIRDMFETMYFASGVGLAASQVGVPLRICVIDTRPRGKKQPMVLINPKLVSKKNKIYEEEGCLSFPGIVARIKRHKDVKVEAVDEKGMPVVIEGSGLLGRAIQHEMDHLDGKVFIDYLPWWTRRRIRGEIKKRKKEGTW
ncbi:MAG: peptide deformylase [Endomicrobiales bacterium]|nr:peptide deformylase [Endomicrobiales bacterium]